MRIVKIAAAFVIFLSLIVILTYGKDLLIPFILALIIWFIIKETRDILSKVKFIKSKFPIWLLSMISAVFIFFILNKPAPTWSLPSSFSLEYLKIKETTSTHNT